MLQLFKDIMDSNKKVMTMAAIWFEDGIVTGSGKKERRISKGTMLRIYDGEIVDVTSSTTPTHLVIDCKGTVDSSLLYFTLQDLKTNHIFDFQV